MKQLSFKILFLVAAAFAALHVAVVAESTRKIRNIVFDIGDVVVFPNKILIIAAMAKHCSAKTIGYMVGQFIMNGRNKLTQDLFALLELYTGKQISENNEFVRDHHGAIVPKILFDWLIGSLNSQEAIVLAYEKCFSKMPKNFVNQALYDGLKIIFNPKLMAACAKPNEDIVQFINFLVKESSQQYNLYILSNYALDSFQALYEEHQDIFSLIPKDHIFISAEHHCVKPHKVCYEKFLQLYKLKPEECLFIDDQEVNIDAAINAGMHGVVYKGSNIMKLVAPYLNF